MHQHCQSEISQIKKNCTFLICLVCHKKVQDLSRSLGLRCWLDSQSFHCPPHANGQAPILGEHHCSYLVYSVFQGSRTKCYLFLGIGRDYTKLIWPSENSDHRRRSQFFHFPFLNRWCTISLFPPR